jgi:hypothetical protein
MITLNVNLGPMIELSNGLRGRLETALKNAAQQLAMQSHAHLMEEVNQKLHSTRQKYVDAVSFSQVDDTTWMISLDKSAMWIEEGMPEHSMLEGMLKSPKAKLAKDGSRYLVVPFQHNKGPTSQTSAAQDLTATVKKELKKREIPYNKIERGPDGKAKLGLLHSFDITKEPVKTHDGPGQGHGGVGDVRQGTTGIPFLQSVRVYQRQMKNGSVNRGIMTFRVASSKHKGSGKWVHPGIQARKFFDETQEWALKTWDTMREEIIKEFADF